MVERDSALRDEIRMVQRSKLQKKLVEAATRETAEFERLAAVTSKMIELRAQECAASLALAAPRVARAPALTERPTVAPRATLVRRARCRADNL